MIYFIAWIYTMLVGDGSLFLFFWSCKQCCKNHFAILCQLYFLVTRNAKKLASVTSILYRIELLVDCNPWIIKTDLNLPKLGEKRRFPHSLNLIQPPNHQINKIWGKQHTTFQVEQLAPRKVNHRFSFPTWNNFRAGNISPTQISLEQQLVGGFSHPSEKNAFQNWGSSSPKIGLNIPKMFETTST